MFVIRVNYCSKTSQIFLVIEIISTTPVAQTGFVNDNRIWDNCLESFPGGNCQWKALLTNKCFVSVIRRSARRRGVESRLQATANASRHTTRMFVTRHGRRSRFLNHLSTACLLCFTLHSDRFRRQRKNWVNLHYGHKRANSSQFIDYHHHSYIFRFSLSLAWQDTIPLRNWQGSIKIEY